MTTKTKPRLAGRGDETRQTLNSDLNLPQGAIEINRQLPENAEAEEELLRRLISWPEGITVARAIVEVEDFSRRGNQIIFERLCLFDGQERDFTPVTIIESFESHHEFDRLEELIRSMAPFFQLRDSGPIQGYSKIIRECSIRRQIIKSMNAVASASYRQDINPADLIEATLNDLRQIRDRLADRKAVSA